MKTENGAVDYDQKLDEKMDEAGFVQFLAKSGVKDTNDRELVEKTMKVFEKKSDVAEKMKEVFKTKIIEELQIKLGDRDLELISEHITKLAETQPDRLLDLAEKIEVHEVATANIQSLENEIANYEKNFAHKDRVGFLGGARKNLEIVGSWLSLGRPMQIFQERQKKGAENAIADVKDELFAEIVSIRNVHNMIKRRLSRQLNTLLSNAQTTEELANLQSRFEGLKEKQESESAMKEVLSGVGDLDEFQKQIDEKIDKQLYVEISEAIDNIRLGKGVLSRLTASLEQYLTSEKFGSREGDEARKIISDNMENIIRALETDPDKEPKVLLLKRVMRKLK